MRIGINTQEKESPQPALAFIMQTVTGIQQPGSCPRPMFDQIPSQKRTRDPQIFYLIIILALYF